MWNFDFDVDIPTSCSGVLCARASFSEPTEKFMSYICGFEELAQKKDTLVSFLKLSMISPIIPLVFSGVAFSSGVNSGDPVHF